MKASDVEFVMGYEIRAIQRDFSSDPPPCVAVRRPSDEAPTYFTPDEARRFAEVIVKAACRAEKKQ